MSQMKKWHLQHKHTLSDYSAKVKAIIIRKNKSQKNFSFHYADFVVWKKVFTIRSKFKIVLEVRQNFHTISFLGFFIWTKPLGSEIWIFAPKKWPYFFGCERVLKFVDVFVGLVLSKISNYSSNSKFWSTLAAFL